MPKSPSREPREYGALIGKTWYPSARASGFEAGVFAARCERPASKGECPAIDTEAPQFTHLKFTPSKTECRKARGASRGMRCVDREDAVSLSLRFGLRSKVLAGRRESAPSTLALGAFWELVARENKHLAPRPFIFEKSHRWGRVLSPYRVRLARRAFQWCDRRGQRWPGRG